MPSDYILLRHIRVHNANALSGPFTVGFPAVTAWMGFVHALERKLSDIGFPFIRLSYTGVICHSCNLQIYKSPEDITYCITGKGKPLNRNGRMASFIEEARCNLNVSLFISYDNKNIDKVQLQNIVYDLLLTMKIAGGDILSASVPVIGILPDNGRDNNRLLRKMMPGYALLERRDLMSDAMNRGDDAMDALLNYIAVTREYIGEKNGKGKKKYQWHSRRKAPGWIIPVVTGFHGISPPGNAENQRAEDAPHRFAESVVTLGEFRRVDKLRHPADMWWEYSYQKEKNLYLCQQVSSCFSGQGEQR
ncbi:type I-F CRISPR-associated protein Csy2 [Morganella psychrotolerans]|uniref:type I-F CRISPR-associated protein Csy2 n=1 Tax=Morganella psychrotolerans TaxID=368603 RepID=UPI0039B08340